uniref:Bindin n=1 Tax=Crassostrea sikamea TaxID=94324 RepID=E7BJ58_CRASI|nr:bindin [Crassostrea sikamea]
MLMDWLSLLFGALCVYLQTSLSDGALPNKRQMDQLIKGVKWNWEHQKTYAVVKSGSGYIDVDVVSKYRLDGRSKLPTTRPHPSPTKKTVKPPRPPTNKKNPPKPRPRPIADKNRKINPRPPTPVGGSKNLALGKKTYVSSVYGKYGGQYCVNGNTKDYCHTRGQNNPWIRIDLGAVYKVDRAVIYNRNTWGGRFRNAFIHVEESISRLRKCGYFKGPGRNSQKITIKCPGGMKGRFTQIQARAKTHLNLAEVQVFGG